MIASFMSALRNSGSAPDRMMFVFFSTMAYCSSPMPIISQMILRGSRADTCCTKSHGPVSSRSSTISAAVRCTSSSNFLIIFGVKARDTIRRSLACLGSSMLIIEPKYSLNSTGRSMMFVAPAAEENSSGFRLASTTSACLTSA